MGINFDANDVDADVPNIIRHQTRQQYDYKVLTFRKMPERCC